MSPAVLRELRKFVAPEFITGDNSRVFAGRYAGNFRSKNIILATDKKVLKQPWMKEITAGLDENSIEYTIFSDISENTRESDVMTGADVYESGECTGIVAVGGGSVLDCAKGIGIVVANKGHISDYVGVDLVTNPCPPMICVPTTAGSSADVSQYAVIRSAEKRKKSIIVSKSIVPDVTLIDPVTLATLPDSVTINSGIDALTHAIEAYVSNGSSHLSSLLSLEAIRLLGQSFPYPEEKRSDLDFRFDTMLASLYAGIAFSNAGLGLIHSMSHAIGGIFDLPHGLSSSIVMDPVISYNYNYVPEGYRKIAEALGIDVKNKGADDLLDEIFGKISMMRGNGQEDLSLSSYGASEDDIEELVKRTYDDPCIATNPVIPSAEVLRIIFQNLL
ncbi:iron-containing alcohol dehydrogenase [Methanoplanus sp. FWC-SCC4]|uniref:Iron-containing alcohol dehydrogenase n=1 Tax=Methanochimaera problematica TaxID=2609417 RepID=A0AA97I500_9EURY|nr:iron-containing alcohol dehydrogenase [Methanoplanus sp. FWC-SCC4]WOF16921.1 iron-containing alcohol dehydrogenase [Methanoplanus sp. FWC-SCC4]